MTKAIRRFSELQKEFPSSPHIGESFLYTAKAFIEDDNLNKAEELVEMILEKYPSLDKDQQVSLLLVEIFHKTSGKCPGDHVT